MPLAPAAPAPPHILVFSHTSGYRHASIEPGIVALEEIAAARGYAVTASEDPGLFTADGLAPFDAIVFLSATTQPNDPASEWLQETGRAALKDFVRSGRGVVGIHAAADSHYHWPWYRQMLGAAFASHPPGTPEGRIVLVESGDITVRALPASFLRHDEWYYFKDVGNDLTIVAAFDPASIGEEGDDLLPLSWRQTFEGARIFYTGMGHTNESFAEPLVRSHISAGLGWVVTGAE
jgi:type 1 glutamine amidotransferase